MGKAGIIGQISNDVKVKVGTAVIMLLLGSAVTMLVSFYSGSKDGSIARQENEEFHPKIQGQVDTLCRNFELEKQRSNLSDIEMYKMVERIDKRLEVIYINELEGNN